MRQKAEKIKEHDCPACDGKGYPAVKQPEKPGLRIYPVQCKSCGGKGKVTDAS
jgi:DnaJ-class molecular chaperone